MKIVFRVDASNQIGTGHFMRCLTLAETLYKHGVSIMFVSRHIPPYFVEMLKTKGCQFLQLPNIEGAKVDTNLLHADWLGVGQLEDALATKNALSTEKCDWLIVDHYALDSTWENVLRPVTKKIMVIDDLADRKHNCDILLDQNHHSDMQARYKNIVPQECQLLLGPKYALLREEFSELHKLASIRTGDVNRILVNFGGIDPENYTEKAILALANINQYKFDVDVVIGTQHAQKKEIQQLCSQLGYELHIQTNKMAELMLKADLALGASGSTTWERCCLGLPSLSIAIAYNQKAIAVGAKKLAVHDLLESYNNDIETEILTRLVALMPEQKYLSQLSENGLNVVDGLGVNRAIESLNR